MDHRKRLAHASRHLKALNRSVSRFTNSDPYIVGLKYDAKERLYIARIIQQRELPDRWPLQVGDIVHNMRSALDSLTYALAVRASGIPNNDEVKKIQFPICETPTEFSGPNGQCKRRLKLLSPAARAAIERLQPYNGRVKGFRHPLSVLNDLANIDKHRHILVVAQSATSTTVELVASGLAPGTTIQGFRGIFKDGAILGRWAFRGHAAGWQYHPKMNVKSHLAFDVSFGQGPPAFGGSVGGFLGNLHDVIRDTVFPPLEALLV